MGVQDADSHKLGLHPHAVSKWLVGVGQPMHAEIGITNRCNHHCSFCTLDWITHGGQNITTGVLYKALADLEYLGVESVYLAGEGEPTLHPDFSAIVNQIAHMGMKVAVSTNGQRFYASTSRRTLKDISWLRFSLDTIDPDLYYKIHGVRVGQLNQVLTNISNAVQIKKLEKLDVDIGVQIILTEETALTLNDTVEFLKKIGVDNVQIKPCHNHPSSSYQTKIVTGLYDHVKVEMGDYETPEFAVLVRTKSMERLENARTYKRCHGFDFYVLINASGDVVPCNVFYHKPGYIYGNINEKSLLQIWRSAEREHIIQNIEESCFSHCGDYRCRLDVMNRHLERVKNPEENDCFI